MKKVAIVIVTVLVLGFIFFAFFLDRDFSNYNISSFKFKVRASEPRYQSVERFDVDVEEAKKSIQVEYTGGEVTIDLYGYSIDGKSVLLKGTTFNGDVPYTGEYSYTLMKYGESENLTSITEPGYYIYTFYIGGVDYRGYPTMCKDIVLTISVYCVQA